MTAMSGVQVHTHLSLADHSVERMMVLVLFGVYAAVFNFFARHVIGQIHPQSVAVTVRDDGVLHPTDLHSHQLMVRRIHACVMKLMASAERVTNGKQNVDRRIPSGRNPGGGAQR
jgi:hypothetical protein